MKNMIVRFAASFRHFALRCAMFLPLLAATAELRAQTFAWNTNFNGNWGDATSWANAAVPGATDAAVINDGGAATVNGTFSVGSLTVGGTNNGKTSTLLLNSSGPSILNIADSTLNVGVNGGIGVVSIAQQLSVSTVPPRLNVQNINLGDGGTLNFSYTQINPTRFTLTNNIIGSGAGVNFLYDAILSGNNTYTGPTAIAGSINVFLRDNGVLGGGNYGGNIGRLGSSSYATLSLQSSKPQTLSGTISGSLKLSIFFGNVTLDPTNTGGNTYSPATGSVSGTEVTYGTLTMKGNDTGSVVGSGRFEAKSSSTVNSAAHNPMGRDVDATSPSLIIFNSSTWNGGGFSNAFTTLSLNASTLNNGIWHKNRAGTISAVGANTIGGTYILRGSGGTPFNTFDVASGGSLNISANMTNDSGDAAFIKNGSGILILSGSNSYTGTTTINAGTLAVGNGGATGNLGGGAIVNNGTLSLNRSDSFAVTNDISGTGSLVKAGAGTATISGANTYAGATTVNAGTLRVGNAGTSGNLGFGEVSMGNGTVLMIDRSDDLTLANVISGAGSLRKVGANTLTLSGLNTYTGGTVISNGTVSVTGKLANNAGNTVTVNSGATFSLDGTDVFGRHFENIVTPIVINGGMVTNGGTFYNALGPVTLNGGTLATAGPGVNGYSLSLKGTVTANSNSTISGPGVTLGAGGVNSTTFNVASGVALTVNDGLLDGPSDAWPSSQPSSLVKSGAGSLVLNGTNAYTGDTTISNGTVAVTGSGVLNSGNYDGNINLAAAGSTLVVDTAENQSLGGIISGSGSLVKTSTGTLTVTGNDNVYTGTTTIGGGTLALNGTHTGGGTYTVQSGATLKGEGRTASAVIVDSGGNITPGNSPGELTIGDLTLNGTLNIFIDGDSTSLLTVVGNANVTGGGVSFTSGAAPTEDVYVFLSASGTLTSPFGSITGLSGALSSYQLLYDANDGIAFLKLNTVTNVVEAIFPGPNAVIGSGTTNFNVYVYNGGTNPLAFSASGDSNNTFGSIAATNVTSSNGVELSSLTFSNGSGTFGTNTASFNAVLDGTTNATSFDVVVYDHASNVVTGTNFNFGAVHAGAGTVTSTNSVTVSNKNDSFRIALGVTNNNTNAGITIDSVGGLAQGDAAELFATLDTSAVAPGRFTNNAGLVSYDDSDLNGASTNLGTVGVQLTGYVYTGQGVWIGSGGDWQDFDDWQEPGGTPGLDGALSVNDTALFGTDGTGPVTLNTNAELLSVTFSNASTPYVLSGTGTLVLTASGTNPATINTLAGSHTISNAVAPGSDLVLSNTAATGLTLSGVVSGVNGLLKTGAGTTTLSASNTYQGGTVIEAGTLVAGTSTALGTGEVTFTNSGATNAALLVDGSSGVVVISNTINVLGTATIGSSAIFDAPNPLSFAGPINLSTNVTLVSAAKTGTFGDRTDFSGGIGGTGDVTITTAGTNSRVIFMTTANTFDGDVFISPDSVLQLSDATPSSESLIPDAAIVDVGTNGFLKLAKGNNSETIAGLTGTGTVEAIAGTNTLIVGSGDASSAFDGLLRDNGGTLAFEKIGAGTFTLGGTATYTGGTYINQGVMNVTGSVSGTKQIWVDQANSTLNITNGGSVSTAEVAIGQPGSAGNSLNIANATSSLSVSNVLYVGFDGTANTLNVSEGTVTAGYLWVGRQGTASNNSVTLDNSAAIAVTNELIVGYSGSANAFSVLGGSTANVTGGSSIEVGKDAGANENSLIVSGAGSSLTSARPLLVGREGSSNSVTVEDGGVLVTGQARIGLSNSSTGNTVTVDGGGSGGGSWTVNGTLQVGSEGNSNTLNITNGGLVTVSSNIWVGYTNAANSDNLIRVTDGSRLQALTGAELVVGPSLGTNNRVIVADGGDITADTIQLPNGKLQIGDGGAAGTVTTAAIYSTNGGGVVEFNHTNAPYNFDPIMAGTVSVLHSGSGTTVLLGDNIYSGTTTIEDGILQIGDGGTAGRIGTGNVTNNATLVFNRSDAITASNVISGTGELIQRGTGTTTLAGDSTYIGGTTVEAGQLNLAGRLANDSNNVLTVKSNAVVSFDRNDVFGIHSDAINAPVVIEAGGKLQNGGAFYNGLGPVTLTGGTIEATATQAAGYSFSFEGDVIVDGGANTSTIAGPGIALGAVTKNSVEFDVRNGAADVDLLVSAVLVDGPSATYGTPQPSALVKSGEGKMVMSGANTYSGGTTLNAGTIVAQSQTALGTGSVTLLGGTLQLQSQLDIGSLFWDGAATIAIANPAAGHFVNLGTNNLTLTNGINNFDLTGFSLTPTPVALLTSANMSLFGTDLFGVLGISGYNLFISNNTLYISSLVQSGLIARPSVTVVADTEAYPSVTYLPSGILNVTPGGNLTVTNPVIMSNNSTTIVNGRFTSPGGFTVQGGSVLTGAGTLIGNVINSGLLNPGNPTGQMTIQGNFTQTPSGTTGLQVAGPNTFSQLFITGTATLAGTLQVTPINGYALQFGDKYQFLTAQGGISGEYDNIAMPSGYRGRFLTSENNTKGSLLVAPETYTQVALTPNQRRVAKALDAFIPAKSGDRQTVSIALDELRESEYPAAFEAIMPTLYPSLPTMAFNQANALNSSMFQRMWMQRINGTGFSTRGMQAAALQGEMGGVDDMQTIVADPERMRKWGVFVDGNGIFATANSAGVLQDYKSQSGGVAAGASYKWNENFATGVYVGYQGLQAQYDNDSRVIDNAVRFGGFGTLGIGGWYLNGLVGGAWHTYDVDREIEFGTIDRTARGNPDAGEFDLALATGYDIKAGNFTFGPVTSMQYTYVGVQGFRENGADSLNLDVDPYNASSLLYSLGAQLAYRWEIGKNFAVTPMLSASWQHEFMQNAYPINAAFYAGGPASPFMFQTSQPQQDYFMAGAGVGLELGETWDVSFFWNAVSGNSDLNSQNIYLSIGAEF